MPVRIALVVLLISAASVAADDWPHWMGPTRDNVWSETGILEKFPAGGPKILWRSPIASGFAGPAVANGRVFATDFATAKVLEDGNFARKASDGQESVMAFDAATGKPLWKQTYPVQYSISYPTGPAARRPWTATASTSSAPREICSAATSRTAKSSGRRTCARFTRPRPPCGVTPPTRSSTATS